MNMFAASGYISKFLQMYDLISEKKICIKNRRKFNYRVSAVVPAFNEEKYIKNVLKTLLSSKYLDEVICVNDGSTDNTLNIINKLKNLKVINLTRNHGKAYAVSKGVEKATGEIIVLFDADIKGLRNCLIKDLIYPLKNEDYDISIGFRSGKLERMFFKPFFGERAYFRKDLLPHLKKVEKKGYGLELYLNHEFRNKKVKIVDLHGVVNVFKQEKQSPAVAFRLTLKVFFDIFEDLVKHNNPMYYFLTSYLPFYVNNRILMQVCINRFSGVFYENLNFISITPYSFQRKNISLMKSMAIYSGLTSILFILSASIFVSSLDIHNRSVDRLTFENSMNNYRKSYIKYEDLLLSKVWEPVVKTVPFIEFMGLTTKKDYKFTTGFASV